MISFSPQPDQSELPARFPSPFDRAAVHPLARRAAIEMLAALQLPAAQRWRLDDDGNGKMFGVLIVENADGAVGYLRGFSGMLDGEWEVDGWAPPVFNSAARDAIWISGDAEMRAMAAQRDALAQSPKVTATALRTLDDARTARSRELLPLIQDTYRIANVLGEVRSLRELFAPAEPPGGAGDCAAPKLLAQAFRLNLRPIAIAELWCGAPPRSGDRRTGSFYPACRGKCAPLLAHMLSGLPADPPPLFGAAAIPADEPRVVFEDEWMVVVDKPCGLLSVPGRGVQMRDCVVSRLRTRFPDATGPIIVHRLDLDTSGLLLASKDIATYAALQRLFATREITKRYVAWVDGDVRGESGMIELPLRPDIDDRPRHIHDSEFGKHAVTTWRVLDRVNGRTRVAFSPHTGRTHQLRVHAAHPLGLDAPIVGDRLYGRAAPEDGERLLLHAESLAFVHPVTGESLTIERLAPF